MSATVLRTLKRPLPPPELLEDLDGIFLPSPDLANWARMAFIEDGAPLLNPDHCHLQQADLGFLWTSVPNSRQGRTILGQCEMGNQIGGMGKWAKARAKQQLREWFGGEIPTFVITISAQYAAECSDLEFCALVEHELFHAAQILDEFGSPKFTKDGRPVFGLCGHDLEEFIGVVKRYGIVSQEIAALVEAANKGPEIGSVRLAQACGTCLEKRVA